MKCSECEYLVFSKGSGYTSRYYCKEAKACKEVLVGARIICRCDRGSAGLKVKNSPRWCKLKVTK